MKTFHLLTPEVPGGLGPGTILHREKSGFPVVTRLEYRFTDWLGDDLFESFPCFVVTERLANRLKKKRPSITGATFADLTVSLSPEFLEMNPDHQPMPNFVWLRVMGRPGIDDFGISEKYNLVVSDLVLRVLHEFNLNYCKKFAFPQDPSQSHDLSEPMDDWP